MNNEKDKREGVVLIPLEGKLMGGAETNFISSKLHDFLSKGCNKIVLDFENVDWINSLGIGALIKWLFIIRENGGDLRFTNTKNKVNQYLKITKLATVIKTFNNPQDAINSFYTSASC